MRDARQPGDPGVAETRWQSRAELSVVATGRDGSLFGADLATMSTDLVERLTGQRVLVIGGAGSIGAATVAELTRFDVRALHIVDLSENGLAELVRDLRGRAEGLAVRDLWTLPLDFGSATMCRFLRDQPPYDYVLNFAAIKHVRSEKDTYSLLHMLDTNVLKAWCLLDWLVQRGGTQRYFSVSTDKAANPVNLMGASKRLMEHVIFTHSVSAGQGGGVGVTSARFANVAFSDGSLLDGWLRRLEKRQPLAVPRATRRYFLSVREAGQLCLLAAVCGPDRSIVIPRLEDARHLVELEGIARDLLRHVGYAPVVYEDEGLARAAVATDVARSRYPLLLTPLDTTGEKPYEKFVGEGEKTFEIGLPNLLAVRYEGTDPEALARFQSWLRLLVKGDGPSPGKDEMVRALSAVVPELRHVETNKQLDHRL
jgi:FlaA1/EpsC-like NDP-sugar epimerase